MTPTPLTDYHTFSCDPKYSRPSVDYVDASFCKSLERALAAAQAELAALKRGEFICRKCGLRKDGEGPIADF